MLLKLSKWVCVIGLLGLIMIVVALSRQGGVGAESPAQPPKDLWVGESQGILKIDANDGSIQLSIPDALQVGALAPDPKRDVLWAYSGSDLDSYSFDGVLLTSTPVDPPGGGNNGTSFLAMAVNPASGGVWLGIHKDLYLFDSQGFPLLTLSLAEQIQALALDETRSILWAATSKSLDAFEAETGMFSHSIDLGKNPLLLDIDLVSPSGDLWVALHNEIQRYDVNGQLALTVPMANSEKVDADGQGGLWIASQTSLKRINELGEVLLDLGYPNGFGSLVDLIGDPTDPSAWVTSQNTIVHYGGDGTLLHALDFTGQGIQVHDLAAAFIVDAVPPILSILYPVEGAFIADFRPTIQVEYSDEGTGVDPDSLSFEVDGLSLDVDCQVTEGGSLCVPWSDLPEGTAMLSATVQDLAGNISDPVVVHFTVDTIPPWITVTAPGDGLITNQEQQTIEGFLNESADLTLNGQPISLTQSWEFQEAVILAEGVNSFTLRSEDPAGNSDQMTFGVTLDTVPPAPVDLDLLTVGSVQNGEVTLEGAAGSAEPETDLRVTNSRTGQATETPVASDGSFSLVVPAQEGDSLSLVLLDTAGNVSLPVAVTIRAEGEIPPDPSTVAPPFDPTVYSDMARGIEFLYSGPDPIQTGVAPGTIEFHRAAVLRGKVTTRDNEALPGVRISILHHPEFGQTFTREDGLFDLAVNGGGYLNICYSKQGFLPVQRRMNAPWRQFTWSPDVIMIPADANVTAVNLTAPIIQTARGSLIQDQDGTRRATLLFPPGTTAHLSFPDGSTQPVSTLNVRATEYTVGTSGPKAMPAELPPQSGYTYCVELSADEVSASGAAGVTFDSPVIFYLENFIGAPFGTGVPAGYYDFADGAWKAYINGRVVFITGIANGTADVDIDGDGQPDDPSLLGITVGERERLATLYAPGQSLWRVLIPHFTPWDCNWPFGPPADAVEPPAPSPEDNNINEPCEEDGSIIGVQNQTLGQAIPITGTPFSIHYQSQHTSGRKDAFTIELPVSGDSIPASLAGIEVEVSVAGQRHRVTLPPQPNQAFSYIWDGLDAYGRRVQGSQPVKVRIGYDYEAQYYAVTSDLAASFGRFAGEGGAGGGTGVTFTDPDPESIILWKSWEGMVGTLTALEQGLGGWSLDAHHFYDPVGKTLYLGDGREIREVGILEVGTVANITTLSDIRKGSDGSAFYKGQRSGFRDTIYRIDPNGTTSYYANTHGFSTAGFEMAEDGGVFIADKLTHVIRKVNPNGTYAIFAGTGTRGSSGDGGPATQADIDSPNSLTLASDGSLYFSEWYGKIRRVGPDGIITTVVQRSSYGRALDAGADGSLYYQYGAQIWRLHPDGTTTLVAGNGLAGSTGDGGPATEARIQPYIGLAVGPNGAVYFPETYKIRCVGPDGIINTIAGTGSPGSITTDGMPALQEPVRPVTLEISPSGELLFSNWGSRYTVRKITSTLPGASQAETFIPSDDGSHIYIFDQNMRHLRTVNSLTGSTVFEFGYNGSGILASVTDDYGNLTSIERDGQGCPTAIVSPENLRTPLTLDPNGYLASIANPAGGTTSLDYSSNGLMEHLINPRGYMHTFIYDGKGRLTNDQNPGGGFVGLQLTDADSGYSMTSTSAEGRVTTYGVELLPTGGQRRTLADSGCSTCSSEVIIGNDGKRTVNSKDGTSTTVIGGPDPRLGMAAAIPTSLTIRTPSGLTLDATMDRTSTLTDPTDPLSLQTQSDSISVNGRTFTSTYDAASRTLTSITPAGRQAVTTLDALGQVSSLQIPGLLPVSYGYDAEGRISSVTQGSRVLTQSYDPEGFLESITDPLSRTVSFAYDANGRVTTQTLTDGRHVAFTYDTAGNVTSITPPGKPAHSFSYTSVDLQGSYTPPQPDPPVANPATTYTFDLDKNLTRIERPDGTIADFAYDSDGRLNRITTAEGSTNLVYASHSGHLISLSTPSGESLSLIHDGFLQTEVACTGTVNGTVSRVYDNDFRVASTMVNGANQVNFSYDNDGLLKGAGGLALTRDPQNGMITVTNLGAVTDSRTYNEYGEPLGYSVSSPNGFTYSIHYTRDTIGRIATKTENIAGSSTTFGYFYDVAGRLTDVTKDGSAFSHYNYDLNGNRLSKIAGGTQLDGTYDNQDRLLSYSNFTYTYTANGELLLKTDVSSGDVTAYVYDFMGNLRSVTVPDGTTIEYIVDGQNRRIGKKVNGTLTKAWLYESQLRPIAELDGSGNLVSRFVYATHINVPDYMVKGGVTYRILTDHLGSPRFVIDIATGAIAQRIDYDEFGNVLLDTNPGFQPFGFAGGIYDAHSDLIRFGFRDYDTETGRWVARDPIFFNSGTSNLYVYAENDPIDWTDPTGLIVWDLVDIGFWIWSLKNFNDCPGLGTGFELALDTVSLLPVIPSLGYLTKADDALKLLKFKSDQGALIDLAKEARRRGISEDEARTLLDWADEYKVSPALDHTGTTHWAGGDHIRVGPVNHIPVRN